MEKTSAIFTLLALVLSGLRPAQAQTTLVHYQHVGVMKSSVDTGLRVYLGNAMERVKQVLGTPTRTDTFFAEMEEKTATRWYYNNCQLTFIDGRLVLYNLKDATLAVGRNFATSFKVGDLMGHRNVRVPGPTRDAPWTTREVDYFHGYQLQNTPSKSRNIPYAISTTLGLRDDNSTFEGHFEVLFNDRKRIININLSED